jgi:hypothetical protein
MKRLALLLMSFGLLVSVASADQKMQGSLHKHTTTTGAADRVPKEPGLPKHRTSYAPPAHAAKAGSADSKLKELERQNAKAATGPAARKVAAPKVAALKSSEGKGGNKGSMNFGYQAPKGGTKNTQTSHAGPKGGHHTH